MRAFGNKQSWFRLVVSVCAVMVCGLSAYGQNTAPVACISDAGRMIEATEGTWEARVTLDGSCSFDADDDINDFVWFELVDVCDPNRNIFLGSGRIIECNLPLGMHVIILDVTDATGISDTNEAVFTIEDLPCTPVVQGTPPLIEPNEPNTAIIASGSDSNNPQEGTSVILPASQSPPLKSGKIIGWGSHVTPNQELSGLTSIAAGWVHSLTLKSDGTIVGWGYNYYGQAAPPAGNDFIAIATGYSHSLALKSDGSIVCWGANSSGQAAPPAGNEFIAIAAGARHSLALKSDRTIVGWGDNGDGQSSPPSGSDFVAIAAGYEHSLALKSNGTIVGWGYNRDGRSSPPSGSDFAAIAAGGFHSLALKSDGTIVGWGRNNYGQSSPPSGTDFVAIAAGFHHSLALKSDGTIVGWGLNNYGQSSPPSGSDFVAIAAGGYHSLALKSDGTIIGWGDNYYGQSSSPSRSDFVAIAAGGYHSLSLKSNGTIVGWGDNRDWDGSWIGQATPPLGSDFVAIAAGLYHSLALKSDGTIVGWGYKSSGQSSPPSGSDFVTIAAGLYHSLALKSDGTIVGWGNNSYGQSRPPSGSDFAAISAGGYHSLALKSDGTIVGWGLNDYGQSSPPSGSDFVAIAAGFGHSLALKSDGTIVGWGYNYYGQSSAPSGSDFVAIAAGVYHSLAIKEVIPNVVPVSCIVGGDRMIEAGSNCEARVVLDGSCSSDEDSTPGTNNDIASFEWYEANSLLGSGEIIECNLPLGEHIITLNVTDIEGESDSNEVVITVVDATPPVIVCPNDITVYARLPAGEAVDFEANAVDLCDSQVEVVSSPASGSVFAPGETTVVCTAADDSGNSSTCSFTVTVIPPVEMPMNFTPGVLNTANKGQWMKAHFVLPDGYEISDIDVNTPAVLLPLGIESNYINVFVDRGREGESGVEIGFERRGFCDAFGDFGPAEITVSARLTNGQYFYGTDTIKVIANDFESLSVVADYWLASGCTAPDWCGGADVDASGTVDLTDFALFDGCCVEVF
jgi:alpha-tubulin suppressor-like RCC1 family protein